MKNLYLILIVLLPLTGFSQGGENDNWAFGNFNLVNFSSSAPNISTCDITTIGGAATVSDAFGNLLFFTDGERVWNGQYTMMNNGCCLTSQGGDYDPNDPTTKGGITAQGAMIVPYPGHPDEYFIFTTNGPNSTYNYCAYSKVDMLADNGNGDVVLKNVPLKDHTGSLNWTHRTEGITVVENYDNYWILIPHKQNLLAYNVDENGVDTTPVVSPIVFTTSHVQIKVSPDKAHLAIVDSGGWNYCLLYDFDANTGKVVSSHFVFQAQTPVYSVEFSSQSNMLWFATGYPAANKTIYGYDINNLTQNPVIFNTNKKIGSLQRRPDGKIYVAIYNSDFLAEINNPNSLNATFNSQAIPLIGTSTYGLPQLIPPPVCIQDLTLTGNYVPNSSLKHEVSNKIITLDYYALPVLCHITMDAGNYIEMLPKTELRSDEHGVILAKIGGCYVPSAKPVPPVVQNNEPQIIYLPNNAPISNFEIYPNPVVDVLNITLPNSVELQSATMHDLLGKQTQVSVGENNTINMSQMASGVYILKLETNQGTMTQKVIKN